MAEKDRSSTQKAANQAQSMTERSPGSRDVGGKEAGTLHGPDRTSEAHMIPAPTEQGQPAPQRTGRPVQPDPEMAARGRVTGPVAAGEPGQTEINTEPPNPGMTHGIGADPMNLDARVGQTEPLPPVRRGPVWLKNEAGEDYLAPGEGPKKGDTVELVGPGGERWAAEVMQVHGDRDSPDATLDLRISGIPGPGAARAGGVRAEFPS